MATIAENLERMDAQLERWGVKIDALVAQAEVPGTKAAVNHRELIDELKASRAAARGRLEEFRAESRSRWRRSRRGMATAWTDLMTAFRALERRAGK
jgi:hypothetical protein